MHHAKRVAVSTLIVLASIAASGSMLYSQTQTEQPAKSADNTKVNTRDRADDSLTADQQKESQSDREITRRIRQSLVKDESLSTYAHNVKIITRDGQVTLKGPVRSENEKQTIEVKATEVAGENKVTNQLDIEPQQQ
jgi:hyperosmotically inducible periplasmic protein